MPALHVLHAHACGHEVHVSVRTCMLACVCGVVHLCAAVCALLHACMRGLAACADVRVHVPGVASDPWTHTPAAGARAATVDCQARALRLRRPHRSQQPSAFVDPTGPLALQRSPPLANSHCGSGCPDILAALGPVLACPTCRAQLSWVGPLLCQLGRTIA